MSEPHHEIKELDMANMGQYKDGKLADKCNEILDAIIRDCEARPLVTKPRKLKFEIVVTPQVSEDSATCDSLDVQIFTKPEIPWFYTAKHNMGVHHRAGKARATYHDFSTENYRQQPLLGDATEDQDSKE